MDIGDDRRPNDQWKVNPLEFQNSVDSNEGRIFDHEVIFDVVLWQSDTSEVACIRFCIPGDLIY